MPIPSRYTILQSLTEFLTPQGKISTVIISYNMHFAVIRDMPYGKSVNIVVN